MTEQFYQCYPVDEMPPVQFVGVYTMHWRPEWGEPEVMFAEVDAPLYNAALQLLEACRGLVKASTIPHEHIEQCPADLGEAECICGFHTALDAARTAIANATTTEADRVLEANRRLLHGDTDWEKQI